MLKLDSNQINDNNIFSSSLQLEITGDLDLDQLQITVTLLGFSEKNVTISLLTKRHRKKTYSQQVFHSYAINQQDFRNLFEHASFKIMKPPFAGILEKTIPKNFVKLKRKHLHQGLFLNKNAGLLY